MAYKHKLSLILILFALLSWPVLTLAQTGGEQSGAGQAESATGQKGECQPGGEQKCPEKEQKRQNSAEAINVKLQVPLPFVPLNCSAKDANGSSTPAVCKLTDYIAGMYRLLVGLGALFAVVMFIIAGYQWIFAAGSADKISAAKKRIMGAFMGLILALLSYVILNSISARLVELRLPLVDPVPAIYWAGGNACYNIEEKNDDKELIKAELNQQPPLQRGQLQVTDQQATDPKTAVVDRAEAFCGKNYTIPNIGECRGTGGCPAGQGCFIDRCEDTFLWGNISWGLTAGDLTNPFVGADVKMVQVAPICGNSAEYEVATQPVQGRAYKISKVHLYQNIPYRLGRGDGVKPSTQLAPGTNMDEEIKKYVSRICGDNLKGFALKVLVNDSSGLFGLFANDDHFGIGKDCSQPLITTAGAGSQNYKFSNIDWSQINASQLYQIGDFLPGPYQCNINVIRDKFPNL